MMKIAFLLQHYFPYGGLQRDCVALARLMRDRGYDVSIVTRRWDGEQPEGLDINELGSRGMSNMVMDRKFEIDVAKWLKSTGKWDCVVGFSRLKVKMDFYYAADPCYQLRITRDRSPLYRLTPRYRHGAELERCIFSNEGRGNILLLTDMEIDAYRDAYSTRRERLMVLPPSIKERNLGAKEKEALREATRKRMGWADDAKILLFVGSGFATKGLDRAIQALARLSTSQVIAFYVVGTGKIARYKKLASRLGVADRVNFLGGRDDAWELMVASDLVVHPARSENTGTVLVEALSAGTGVLTTDRCGFSSHIAAARAGCVLKSPFDENQLSQKLSKLLDDGWRQRSEKALQYANETDLYSGLTVAAGHLENFLIQGDK